jgi:phosphohistidine phosphatase SixA
MAIVGGAAHREALKKTAAAQKVQDMKRDARRSLQQGGILYAQQECKAVENNEFAKLEAARAKIIRLERIASNKIKAIQTAKRIAAPKQLRAFNKANNIVVPRKPRVVIDLVE